MDPRDKPEDDKVWKKSTKLQKWPDGLGLERDQADVIVAVLYRTRQVGIELFTCADRCTGNF